jgi:hypothetical protein
MTPPVVNQLDVAFVLSVTGAALIWAPAALLVAAGYFGLSWWLTDRRTSAETTE